MSMCYTAIPVPLTEVRWVTYLGTKRKNKVLKTEERQRQGLLLCGIYIIKVLKVFRCIQALLLEVKLCLHCSLRQMGDEVQVGVQFNPKTIVFYNKEWHGNE